MRWITGVVLGLRPEPDGRGVRLALSRRTWVRAPVPPAEADWLAGRRVRVQVGPERPLRAVALEGVAWPEAASLAARYRRAPSSWGAAEPWLWRKGLPVWQVLAAARAGHLIRCLRRRPPKDVFWLLQHPFQYVMDAADPALRRVPFGVWEAVARRLRPAALWPAAWLAARVDLAWRTAIETALREQGVRVLDPEALRWPVRRLLRLGDEEATPEPANWDRVEARLDERGRLWPRAVDRRRAAAFAAVAANQRAWTFTNPLSADDPVGRLVFGWRYSAITGGAGTGKTTAIRRLVTAAKAAGLRVALAALTGRAAAVLGEDAQTLHRVLRYGPWGWGLRRLEVDLLVVDEASMLTWDAAAAALDAAQGRVVFVGDPAQLPPVSGEATFAELVARLPILELSRQRRAAPTERLVSVVCDDVAALLRAVAETVGRWAKSGATWQVLTPYRIGPVGSHRLNRLLQDLLNPVGIPVPGTALRVGDRAMLTRAVPEAGASNGLLGRVSGLSGGSLWLEHRGVMIGPVPPDAVALAYALTIHRAQGSEWDQVLLVCPLTADRRGFIDARMRYVGLTRSRRETVCLLA